MPEFFQGGPTYAKGYLELAKRTQRRPEWWEPLLQIVTQSAASVGEAAAKKAIFNALRTPEEIAQEKATTELSTSQAGLAKAETAILPEKTRMPLQVAERQGQSQIGASKIASTPALIDALKPEKPGLSFEQTKELYGIRYGRKGGTGTGAQSKLEQHRFEILKDLIRQGRMEEYARRAKEWGMTAEAPAGERYGATAGGGKELTEAEILVARLKQRALPAPDTMSTEDIQQEIRENARLQKTLTSQSLTGYQEDAARQETEANIEQINQRQRDLKAMLQGQTPAAGPGASGEWPTYVPGATP